jgi:N-acyl-D-amino-acid deacylase
MHYDLIVRKGALIDGTGAPRRIVDVAVKAGRIAKIGGLETATADREIDAEGQIVAPGVIDIHTHYDAHINWDPYATSSSWHGTTTVVMANCGFGYAPCRAEHRERNMLMMLNTEQIPLETQKAVLQWDWETFPEWMAHLRAQPKGVNTAMYVPMSPLLLYVKGDEVKSRPTTAKERRQMRQILHEAMDAGACGFSFSLLREGNSHVDFDGSPVPTDVMDPEDAYNLAWVLRERGEGVIQGMVEDRLDCRWEVSEQLARISGRPMIHNVCVAYEASSDHPTPIELRLTQQWSATLDWADELRSQGLKIFLQAVPYRAWSEFRIEEYGGFYAVPVFDEFGKCTTNAERMALASDPEWRRRAKEAYAPEHFMMGGMGSFILGEAYGEPTYSKYQGKTVEDIAQAEGKPALDVFFDILVATEMKADFRGGDYHWDTYSAEKAEIILRNAASLPGVSDGGAHIKTFTGGQWPNEFLNWMVKDQGRFTLEEAHQIMSQRPAEAFGFQDRGVLVEGYAADMMIYDFDKLGYDRKYLTLNDVPGGEYRRTVPARGVSHVVVNGEVIIQDGRTTGVHPGQVVTSRNPAIIDRAAAE